MLYIALKFVLRSRVKSALEGSGVNKCYNVMDWGGYNGIYRPAIIDWRSINSTFLVRGELALFIGVYTFRMYWKLVWEKSLYIDGILVGIRSFFI